MAQVNALLGPMSGRLMPGAMHPWMDPARELRLWPHDCSAIYQSYDHLFDCRGHGWANLQSVHLNLPFADDGEFARLHAAVRLLLPIMPALAASSPVVEGRATGLLDNRLDVYGTNARRIPSITAQIIPEPVFSRDRYETEILQRMYRDIAPYDPAGLFRHEWLNARGAIARFDRAAIEIRVLDVQECPLADIAVCTAIVGVLKALVEERWLDLAGQQAWAVEDLVPILRTTIAAADQAVIEDRRYLAALGWGAAPPCTAGLLWRHLLDQVAADVSAHAWREPLRVILDRGPLARRILYALGPAPARTHRRLRRRLPVRGAGPRARAYAPARGL